jgi:hypothetical protein
MDRKSFFRNLLGAAASFAVAPAIQKLLLSAPIVESAPKLVSLANGSLFRDLQLLTPHWYKSMVEKYGDESYSMLTEILNQ